MALPSIASIKEALALEGLPKAFQEQRDKAESLAELANTDMSTLDASGLDSLLTGAAEAVQEKVTDLRDQAKSAQAIIEGQKIDFSAEVTGAFNSGIFGPITLLAKKFNIPGPDGKPLDSLDLQGKVNEALTEGMNTVKTIDTDVIKQQFTSDLKKLLPQNVPGISDFVPGKKGGFNPFDAIGNIEIHQTINSITGNLEGTVVELGKPSKVPAFNAAIEPASPTYQQPSQERSDTFNFDAVADGDKFIPFPRIFGPDSIEGELKKQMPTIEAEINRITDFITGGGFEAQVISDLTKEREKLHALLPQGSPSLPSLADVVDV